MRLHSIILSATLSAMVSLVEASASDSHIAVFSNLPSKEFLDNLTPVVRANILSSSKSPTPTPEILTFDNQTHILVWKFTPEQQDMIKNHEDLVGFETNQIVRIAPFPDSEEQSDMAAEQDEQDEVVNVYPLKTLDVEEQGSDAPNLDGSAGQITNAYLNGTRMSTEANVSNWGLARISQKYLPLQTDYTYPNSSGEGVDVYVIDTGINLEHQEFGGRATWGITTVENSGNIDDNGHGTFVAGVVGGALFGVAKDVRLIAVKALDASGSGSVSDILYGLQYVIKTAKSSGNKSRSVVNLSLGTQKSTALDQAVTALVNAGIIMVAAAGNGDENGVGQDACDFSPASARTALTVGSTDRSDNVASFSNYGPCVNIFAPGVKIRSAWIGSDTATYVSSGTSFSTPFAAGVVATYISERQRQKRANMAPEEVIRAITGMATEGVIHGLDSRSPNLLLFNGIGKDAYSAQESGQFRAICSSYHLFIACTLVAYLHTTKLANSEETTIFQEELELFDFTGDAIDMALRRLLAKVHLPKESQQIDRALEAFAKHYHNCNPGLADSYDSAYAMAFSILLLHTDAHNKNVKRKMNRDTFIMRTRLIEGGENIPPEILDIIYDNIVSVEFQYASDIDSPRASKGTDTRAQSSWLNKLGMSDGSTNQPVNTNDLEITFEKLLPAENPYDYKGNCIDIDVLRRSFSRAPSFMLAGVKTRQSNNSENNKVTSDTGSIYSKVTNVYKDNGYMVRVAQAGVLDRKYELMQGGKRATVRGWRPFGMILSGSQLIFFADINAFLDWFDIPKYEPSILDSKSASLPSTPTDTIVSTLLLSSGQATPPDRIPSPMLRSSTSFASFSPSITSSTSSMPSSYLRPVQIVSLVDAICVCDHTYDKYSNAFRLFTGDGQQFIFRADTEQEVNDWVSKLNYAATVKSMGIRMTGSQTGHRSRHDRQEDLMRRQDVAQAKVVELTVSIDHLAQKIEQDACLRRNLIVLVPLCKTAREKISQYAEILAGRLQAYRLRVIKLECYRTILEKEIRSIRENEMIRRMVGVSLSQDAEKQDMRNRMRRSYSAAPGYQRSSYDGNTPKVPARVSSLVGIPKGFLLEEESKDDEPQRQSNESETMEVEERDHEKVRLVITEPADKPEKKLADVEQQKLRQRSYSNDEVLSGKNKGIWEWTSRIRAGLGGSSEDKQPIPVPAVQALKQTKLMRRRSRSHPTIPAGREQDKPLISNKLTENRQRSNSELSSVGDDEDLCVEEPTSWEVGV